MNSSIESNAIAGASPQRESAGHSPQPSQPGRVPAASLKQLLDKLSIAVQMGALKEACDQAEKSLPNIDSARQFSVVANQLQLKGVQAAELRWRRFDQRRLPALLWFAEQWQLIERAADDCIQLTDQAGVTQTLARGEADGLLEQAVIFWLRTPAKIQTTRFADLHHNQAARLVLDAMFSRRRWLGDIIIATVVINILAVSTSIFAMQVYDRVVPTLAYATLTTLVSGMAIVITLDWFLKRLRARILDSVACEVDRTVSQQVYDHVMNLRLDTRPRSLGTLAAQVGGLDSVRQFFSSTVVFALVDLPFALMFIALIAVIGGPIGWVYALLLPVAAILGWLTQKRLRRLMRDQMIRSNERQGLLVDSIQGTESIRTNNASWRFSELWQSITQTITRYNIQQKNISNRTSVTTASLSQIAYVSALVVGVSQIESGSLTMGALIACSILGGRVIAPVAQSVQHLSSWQNVSQSLEMVNQVLVLDTERDKDKQQLMPEAAPQSIALDAVSFSYPESPVKQVSVKQLCFNAGDRVVMLGPVGSGKSTLLKVLAGMYRPSEGRVRLGQADLWETEPSLVADQINYLPQSVHLFKGSLRSNLLLSGAVSDSHLLEVIADLGIDRIIADNPQGLELPISEGGDGLSGGQRQLVGLGRVLLAQPKIWLLDEPSASLDGESERQALEAIQKHVKADDILIISTHRPALAAKLANRVLVVQQGEVVADGSPEQVIPHIMRNQNQKNTQQQEKAARAGLADGALSGGQPRVI